MWLVALRDARSRPGRFVRTLLAIALGVGFVAGTFVLTDTTDAAFRQAVDEQSGSVDLVVRSVSPFTGMGTSTSTREPMPDDVVDRVAAVPGVATVDAGVIGYAQVVGSDGEAITPVGPPTLGISWQSLQESELTAGRAPAGVDEVVLDEKTAATAGYGLGDEVEILFVGPARTFTIVGLHDASALLGATLSSFDLATAQEVLDRAGVVDDVSITLAEGADAAAVRTAVAAVLEPGQEVVTAQQTRDEAAEQWTDAMGFLSTALLVFAAVALLVGAFLIVNTFSILVTQRTRELGLLRAVGASRRQVVGSVLVEASVVGLVASGVGILLGFGAAIAMLALIRAMGIDLPSTDPVFQTRTAVAALLAGLVTSTVAALVPARRAGAIPPVVAMAGGGASRGDGLRRRVLGGAALLVVGAGAIALGLVGDVANPLVWVGPGAVAVFLGVAAAAPVLARPASALVGPPLERVVGQPAALGAENAARDPKRTAATASALMIGLALVGFVAILADSIKASVMATIDEAVVADLSVMPKGMMGMTGFSPEVAARLRSLDEVGAVAEFRAGQFGLEGNARNVGALDPEDTAAVMRLEPETATTFDALGPGTIAVNDDVLADQGWTVGDEVTVMFSRTGEVDLRIAGVFGGPGLEDNEFLVSIDTYEANFTEPLDVALYLTFTDGVDAAAATAAVDGVLEEFPNVDALDMDETKDLAASQIDQLLAMVSALLGLSLVIAFVGITNTLALSIVERTRELGLLRAIGMSRRQLKRMVRTEATIVAVLGLVLGAVVALGLSWSVVQAMADLGITRYRLPWGQLVTVAVAAVIAAVASSFGPARRAAKLPVLQAVAAD